MFYLDALKIPVTNEGEFCPEAATFANSSGAGIMGQIGNDVSSLANIASIFKRDHQFLNLSFSSISSIFFNFYLSLIIITLLSMYGDNCYRYV